MLGTLGLWRGGQGGETLTHSVGEWRAGSAAQVDDLGRGCAVGYLLAAVVSGGVGGAGEGIWWRWGG